MERTGTWTRLERPDWFDDEGESFVRSAYQHLLDRPADSSGLSSYAARLRAGMSKAELVAELQNSPEGRMVARRRNGRGRSLGADVAPVDYRAAETRGPTATSDTVRDVAKLLGFDGDDFVREAYRAILGRDADPNGLAYYGRRLANGDAKQQILVDLRCDPEGQARMLPVEGLDALVASLQPRSSGADVAKPSSASDLLTLHGSKFVRAAYLAILDREPDAEGLARYLEVLQAGWSRSFVLDALASSPEGQSKAVDLRGLQALLRSYRKGQSRSWAGWYWRNVRGAESDLPPAREVRRLSWQNTRD
jgi:hypothetical protein